MTTDNVDQNEIEKFNALANTWWDLKGPMRALHEINPLRLGFIEKMTPLSDKTVVDIGCGAGILTEALASKGATTTGIDLSEEALAVAKQHAQSQSLSIHYLQTPAETFANENATQFDIVTCMEMLEHVPDPAAIIAAAAQLAKPNALVFFSTINRNLSSYLKMIIGAEYILNMVPKGTHEYEKFIKPSELDNWARAAGLTLQTIEGIDYSPLSKTFSLTQSVDTNYLVCYKKTEAKHGE